MFFNKSNSIYKFIATLVCLLFFNSNNLFSLTQNIDINIASSSPLEIEYVLAKGICKMLSREHDVSKFMGGTNTLNCKVHITNGIKQNLEFIKSKKTNYAIIDLTNIPSNYDMSFLKSLIFFKGTKKNWLLVTLAEEEKLKTCEVTEAIFKNSLELKYLHDDFKKFSHENFIIKKIPIHEGSFEYFKSKKCKFKK
ncbi:hypothetical protein OAQ08_02510 [Alphaproteobacteria bacterium]|nr:hypothetical protein [Alphaproteobacteria bacterium]